MSKKIIWTIITIILIVAIAVATVIFLKPAGEDEQVTPEKNVEGTLEEVMTKLYAGISEENLPMMLGNIEVNSENIETLIGTTEVSYKEALASESMVGSIAHSVVLLRFNDSKEATTAAEKIKTTANPRRWICVEASNVAVKSKGDLVILIMSNETLAPTLEANFDNL